MIGLGLGTPRAPRIGGAITLDSLFGAGNWYSWDAQDAASINAGAPINNDPVGTWNSSGAGTEPMAETGANRPTYQTAGFNGKETIDFSGTNEHLDHNDTSKFQFIQDGVDSWTGFGVFRVDADTGTNQAMFGTAGTSGQNGFLILFDRGDAGINFTVGNGTLAMGSISTVGDVSYATDYYVIFGYNKTTDKYQLYVDTGALNEDRTPELPVGGASSNTLTFGGRPSSPTTLDLDGQLSQIVLADGTAPSDVVADVRTYINTKWGI